MTDAPAAAPATTAPATAAPATAAPDWTAGLSDDDRQLLTTKGWAQPQEMVASYRSLEKLLGGEKIPLPKAADDPAWADVYDKLGRPKAATDYKLDALKDEAPAVVTAFGAEMHKLGLSQRQADGIVAYYMGLKTQGADAVLAETQRAQEAELGALRSEWGAAYNDNTEIARRAAKAFLPDEAAMTKIEAAIGSKALMTLFHTIGTRMGEASPPPHDARSPGAMTPAAAQAEIARLKTDSGWARRWAAGGAEEIKRFNELNQWAYPAAAD